MTISMQALPELDRLTEQVAQALQEIIKLEDQEHDVDLESAVWSVNSYLAGHGIPLRIRRVLKG